MRAARLSCRPAGASDAGGQGRIEVEALWRYRLAAGGAVTKCAVLDAGQCRIDTCQLLSTPSLVRQSHLLCLKRVDARDPANGGLIELDRRTALRAHLLKGAYGGPSFFQYRLVSLHDHCSMTVDHNSLVSRRP